jgi:hypothetical protein
MCTSNRKKEEEAAEEKWKKLGKQALKNYFAAQTHGTSECESPLSLSAEAIRFG